MRDLGQTTDNSEDRPNDTPATRSRIGRSVAVMVGAGIGAALGYFTFGVGIETVLAIVAGSIIGVLLVLLLSQRRDNHK